MRVVFVDNVYLHGNDAVPRVAPSGPHLGLSSLVAVAEGGGHEAVLFDPTLAMLQGRLAPGPDFYRDMAARLLASEPDAVGFTSLGCSLLAALRVARELRRIAPDLPLLLGGPHATLVHEGIARNFDVFDVIVRGEAEGVLLDTLAGLGDRGALRGVPGLTWWDGDQLVVAAEAPTIHDLESLPFPAWHAWPIASHHPERMSVEVGRGCPFSCTYCSTSSFFGRQFRLKPIPRIMAELDHLHQTHGVTGFSLVHDMLTVNRRKVAELCDALDGRGYKWHCSARPDSVDDALLERMAAAGCTGIFYGVETGSPRMQRLIDKRLAPQRAVQAVDATVRHGMRAIVSFITGFPEEEAEDQRQTLDLMGRLLVESPPDDIDVRFQLLTPRAGSRLLEQHLGGLERDGAVLDSSFSPLDHDDVDLVDAHPDIFPDFYYFTGRLTRARHLFVLRAVHFLVTPGNRVLRALLDETGSGLATLVDALWARDDGARSVQALLQDLLVERLGEGHPLASLYRFADAETRLFDASSDPKGPSDEVLVLSQRAEAMHGLHDRAALLAHLDGGGRSFSSALAQDRGSWLLVAQVWPARGLLVGRLSPSQADLVERFRVACPVDVAVATAEATRRDQALALIRRLQDRGVLVAAPGAVSAEEGPS